MSAQEHTDRKYLPELGLAKANILEGVQKRFWLITEAITLSLAGPVLNEEPHRQK